MPPTSDSKRGRRASTIRDVAALAGVSKSTASRAMLGQGVSQENLDRVRDAIEQLDFVPNQIARSLTANSSAVLGLFLRHTRSPFYAHLAGAFEEGAGARGYEVLTFASGDQPDAANYKSLTLMADMHAAGIVVAAPNIDPGTIRQLAARVPLVLVGQMGQPANPGVPFIAPDPRAGGDLLDLVLGYGHRSLALLAVPQEQSPTQWARISWMRDELTRRAVDFVFEEVLPDEDLTDLVRTLHGDGVTAILCPSDWVAFDAIAAATRLGLSVPADLSITGHDGVPPFDHDAFGLSTYRVPVDAMAHAAVAVIDDLVNDRHVDSGGILLFGELVVGRTAGPAPTAMAGG